MLIQLIDKSSNAKTGKIPTSTTCATSCPKSCSFKDKGCYAKAGPVSWNWNKITQGKRGDIYATFTDKITQLKQGTFWRHNVAGDLLHNNELIDNVKLNALVKANKDKKGFTYTHHKLTNKHNRLAIKKANDNGFTINISADNMQIADDYIKLDIAPVVVVVNSDVKENLKTPNGHDIIICPATIKDNVTCKTCQLCQKQRSIIVGFPAHGISKKHVNGLIVAQ